VLSIGKMVVGAEEYYLGMVAEGREEYYSGSGEAPGTWVGSGRHALGLEGEVGAEELRTLLAGFSPQDRTSLGFKRPALSSRVAGFDLTFSAPKSVSLLYGLSTPEHSAAVRDAHDQAVAEALTYLERHALSARRGAGGERRIETEGLVAAAFMHRTSRAGDPQLHTHVLAANAVKGSDGRWSAPDARLLYFHARTAGFVYQASLRAGLVETLGVRFGPVRRGAAELADVDLVVLGGFSNRRAEIEEYLFLRGGTGLGDSSRRTAELAALATREPKSHAVGQEQGSVALRDRWRQQAVELGADMDSLFADLGRPRQVTMPSAVVDQMATALVGVEGLTAQESVFERRDVVRAVAETFGQGAHLDDVERAVDRVLAESEVVPLEASGRGGESLHTTKELLHVEAELLEAAARLATAQAASVAPAVSARFLSERDLLSAEQKAMVSRLVTSATGIDAVIGKAGAGKTTALSLTREIFESAGYRVSGTALSARAAEELQSNAGIDSVTLARFLAEAESGSRTLDASDVLVIDEAGMVGTRAIARLVTLAEESGAKLILVGDPHQLPEIDAGGAFGKLAAELHAVQLSGNRRQHERWERDALDHLRTGSVTDALTAYDTHDRIHLSPTKREAQVDMVIHWLDARDGGADAVMLAVNRSDVESLNKLTRHELRRRGELGADVVTVPLTDGQGADTISFALGDRVICLRNDKELSVLNGTRGRVRAFDGKAMAIETPGGLRELPRAYLTKGFLGHGYASTVHKTQGATYDQAFVLASASLTREAGYVAMSRARQSSQLFVVSGPIEHGHGADVEPEEPLSVTAYRLSVSRAKQMASQSIDARTTEIGPTELGTSQIVGPTSHGDHGVKKITRGDRLRTHLKGLNMRRGTGVTEVLGVQEANLGGQEAIAPPAPPSRYSSDAAPGLNMATDFSGADQPAWITNALGTRPAFVDEQPRYDDLADVIKAFRQRHDIEGDDPIGPRPFESGPRLDYDAVAERIRGFERFRWREVDPPTQDLGLGL
jgi:Ti-type conjugative transfer relaxase TraA